jgi:hypothetical protein
VQKDPLLIAPKWIQEASSRPREPDIRCKGEKGQDNVQPRRSPRGEIFPPRGSTIEDMIPSPWALSVSEHTDERPLATGTR